MFFRKTESIKNFYDEATANPEFEVAKSIGNDLSQHFLGGEYDEIYLTYNEFFSPLSQKTTFEKILPIEPFEMKEDNGT